MSVDNDRRYWQFIFVVLLALCGVLFFVLLRGEPGNFHGIPHPTKTDMLIGGPAMERTGSLLWIGWAYGFLQLVLFVALLAPGCRYFAQKRPDAMKWILILGGILYTAMFTLVFYQYHSEIANPTDSTSGLPWSSWLAIFVLWPCPYLFVAAYSFGFKKFIYTRQVEADG